MRRQYRESDAGGRDDVERLAIDRRFRQPEADWIAAEAFPEVGNAPTDFGFFVAAAGEGEDDMMKRHRERVALAEAPGARVVRANHRVMDVARFPLQPLEQRRAEVGAQRLV